MKRPTSTYLAGSEDLPWQQNGMDIEPLASVTTNPTPKQSSKNIGPKSRVTKTSEKYEASYTQESLFSQVGFHANHSQSQGSNEARMTTVTSGLKCCELYRKQSPLGSLVRMLLGSSTWHSTKCVLTWKVKVTKSNRSLFQLAPLTRHTEETGFGLWLTPSCTAINGRSKESMQKRIAWRKASGRKTVPPGNLSEQVNNSGEKPNSDMMMWPTPTVDNSANVNPKENRFRCLVRAVNESVMWPTPSTRDGKGGYIGGRIRNGKVSMDTLDVAVQHTDNQEKQLGSLNPTWVAWLMGYPTEWLNCVDSEMPSSRKSRQKSSDVSTK